MQRLPCLACLSCRVRSNRCFGHQLLSSALPLTPRLPRAEFDPDTFDDNIVQFVQGLSNLVDEPADCITVTHHDVDQNRRRRVLGARELHWCMQGSPRARPLASQLLAASQPVHLTACAVPTQPPAPPPAPTHPCRSLLATVQVMDVDILTNDPAAVNAALAQPGALAGLLALLGGRACLPGDTACASVASQSLDPAAAPSPSAGPVLDVPLPGKLVNVSILVSSPAPAPAATVNTAAAGANGGKSSNTGAIIGAWGRVGGVGGWLAETGGRAAVLAGPRPCLGMAWALPACFTRPCPHPPSPLRLLPSPPTPQAAWWAAWAARCCSAWPATW